MILTILCIILLLCISVFFSACETALLSSSRAQLYADAKEGSKRAALALKLLDNPEKLLATILLGNNGVNIAASALATGLFIEILGLKGIAWATGVMTVIVLIFCEILPKSLAARAPENVTFKLVRPLAFLIMLATPLTFLTQIVNRLILKLIGAKDHNQNITASELRGAIHLSLQQGAIKPAQHRMLDAILELDSLTVGEVMLHRNAIMALDVTTNPADIPAKLAQMRHTRVPVFEGDVENILGILTVRDYLGALSEAPTRHQVNIRSHLQPPYFVPETTLVGHQMRAFLTSQRHMALVVDEYGSLMGLITLEDILEEIVGEISHEGATATKWPKPAANGAVTLPGQLPIREANRHYNWNLPEGGESVTLAGLVTEQLGHFPTQGESITTHGLTLAVSDKRGQKLHAITITPVPVSDEK